MTCLTPEQLAAASLGLDGSEFKLHVDECAACQEKLAQLRQLTGDLATAHAALDRNHTASRTQLLSRLPHVDRSDPTTAWKRFAFGGLGLSAAAALLLAAFFITSSNQLSAMERIVRAARDVTSFSYKLTNLVENTATAEKPGRTLDCETFTYWRAPKEPQRDEFGDLRGAQKNEAVYHPPSGDEGPVVLTDIIEIHPSGKPGILIDYLAKKYYRVPPLHASDIKSSTPLLWLQAVREQAGKIVEDLGTGTIDGRDVRGFVMTFDDAAPFDDLGPVEVWIDPQTDLPVEFSFRYAMAEEEGFTDHYSVTDIQWNAELDPRLFDTTPPAGFLDVTLPNDERSIAEVVAALKLYAELSGGRYPRVEKTDHRNYVTKFDAGACYREMLELAGFIGPQRDEWASDSKYKQIKQSRPGLDIFERVMENPKWLVGYNCDTVGPSNRDKVLLWWDVATDDDKDFYRLFYGDLRTNIVPRKTWVRFAPPEIVEMTE